MAVKIHILYDFVDGPWGGGNQFLKALRDCWRREGTYSEDVAGAGAVLVDSHHCLGQASRIKSRHPGKLLVHRVGPVFTLARGDASLDRLLFAFNRSFADATIFQSHWTKEKALQLGMASPLRETVITNAPDSAIFNTRGKSPFDAQKVRLIATSWSPNPRKGFDIYSYLDKHLDFENYRMTFVGNCPVQFTRIRQVSPVPSGEVARLLKESDIYVTASRNDACSNGLIEALHCGLPAVAVRDGGNPEIVGRAGEMFDDQSGIVAAIDKVAGRYASYREQLAPPSLDDIGRRYSEFILGVIDDCVTGKYPPKQAGRLKTAGFEWQFDKYRVRGLLSLRGTK